MNLIIALLSASSLLVVDGISVNKRDYYIPHDSNIFIQDDDDNNNNRDNVSGGKFERLKRNHTELPVVAVDVSPTIITNTTTTTSTITTEHENLIRPTKTVVKAFEADDMKKSAAVVNNNNNNNNYRKVSVEDETFGNADFEQHYDVKIIPNKPGQNSTSYYALDTNQVNASSIFNSTKAPINLLIGTKEPPPRILESRQEIVERSENLLAHIKNSKLPERSIPPPPTPPTGLIALVSAVGLATVAVMAYVGLIVWQRYQEYRHGNRELLVNDDFDGNDVNNFEL